jgi:long-subunit acyl-CoA synthetase (AMP-forming)
VAQGIKPGEKVAIISDNRTEWLFAEVGTLSV